MLEWSQPTKRDTMIGVAGSVAFFLVACTIMTAGVEWMTTWWIWLIIVIGVGWMYKRANTTAWRAAGARWVQVGDRWVSLYELRRIRFSVAGLHRVLQLTDSAGRRIPELILRDVQRNPAMWDLIYNGILHSVASGNCDISEKARKEIRIPYELGRDKR